MAAKKSAKQRAKKAAPGAKASTARGASSTRKVAKKRSAPKATQTSSTRPGSARAQARPDWPSALISRVRRLIQEAVPGAVEEAKWRKPTNPDGVPTWSHEGILCTGETYKDHVKLTFAKGAFLQDPDGLFNAGLEGNLRRAIDLREGDALDEAAFKSLVRAAADLNGSTARR